ncbi:Folylpolyglutamate synthetase [Allomyces arbusculus]|nr:Folylpolyglutamate synthetase [Allomyces arbusculus]
MSTLPASSAPPAARSTRNYRDALSALNSLQTNAATLDQLRRAKAAAVANGTHAGAPRVSIDEMIEFLARIGYQPDDLNVLGLVHITGTKGKGSTAALTESVLRHSALHGARSPSGKPIKTGLYSSPHLLQVRERIRINGVPLAQDLFAKYFFEVWDRLEATTPAALAKGQMAKPQYFRFMTLLAFHVFMQEQTTATVLEVGIGGLHDSTNLITKPVATGITSLGFDHMAVLGTTLPEIATQKAGIFKHDCPAYTVPQPAEAMAAIVQYATTAAHPTGNTVRITAPLPADIKLGLRGRHQRINAALAVALAQAYLGQAPATKPVPVDTTFRALVATHLGSAPNTDDDAVPLDAKTRAGLVATASTSSTLTPAISEGLAAARWPGRAEIVRDTTRHLTVYADGAHTRESLAACTAWFADESATVKDARHLVFNVTHARSGATLLAPVAALHAKLPFTSATFSTNTPRPVGDGEAGSADTTDFTSFPDPELTQQQALRDAWVELSGMDVKRTRVVPTVKDALDAIAEESKGQEASVLVTGSLYLVGATLDVLGVPVR